MSALPGREKESPNMQKMVGGVVPARNPKSFLSASVLSSFLRNVSAGPTLRVIRDRTRQALPSSSFLSGQAATCCHKKHGRIWTKGNSSNGIGDGSRSRPPPALIG